MGLFGGLFEKKECSVCGGEIGMLGNRKLEDGNMCKNCARKLSPFFSERRHSTVAEIKQQLAYREENERQLAGFNPTVVIGYNTKVYIDMNLKKFIVTDASSWRAENPDLIGFSQVNSCNIDIEEDRDEIFNRDNDGNEISFNPPRYEYSYKFNINIGVNSPYFDEIGFELSEERPDNRYSELYHQYERDANQLQAILLGQNPAPMGGNMGYQQSMGNQGYGQPMGNMGYQQPMGNQNYGQPMGNMGYQQNPMPQSRTVRCDKCGWMTNDLNNVPKFCPNCGDPITMNDIIN